MTKRLFPSLFLALFLLAPSLASGQKLVVEKFFSSLWGKNL